MGARAEGVDAFSPSVLKNFFGLNDPGRNVGAILPTIRVPTLVVHGEADRNAPIEAARWTADRVPGARLHVLAGRSHLAFFTATVEFADVVRRFVRS